MSPPETAEDRIERIHGRAHDAWTEHLNSHGTTFEREIQLRIFDMLTVIAQQLARIAHKV